MTRGWPGWEKKRDEGGKVGWVPAFAGMTEKSENDGEKGITGEIDDEKPD
jgi:hypothetical protein